MSIIEVFHPLKHLTYQLAEGTLKPDDQNIVLWTDIKQKKICEYNFDTHQYTESQLGCSPQHMPSALFETDNPDQYLVANGIKIQLWQKSTNQIIDQVTHPDLDPQQTRFNDGKLDPNGKLFIGTLDLHDRPNRAALYRLDLPDPETISDPSKPLRNATFTKILDNVSLSNGLGWSNDSTKFYYIDTPTKELKIYNYDLNQATIKTETPLHIIDLTAYPGTPDGLTIHPKSGHIFIAMWGGNQILEIILGGHHTTIYSHPTPYATYPTNLTFQTNNQALITTAVSPNPNHQTATNDGKILLMNYC